MLLSLAWFATLLLIGPVIFWLRTRAWNTGARRAHARRSVTTAAAA
jgi:hypothetical protein